MLIFTIIQPVFKLDARGKGFINLDNHKKKMFDNYDYLNMEPNIPQ